jgi:hypothetical protein
MLSGDKSSTTQVIPSTLNQKRKRVYVMRQCPHLGCDKSYRQSNQLKWHQDWVHRGIRTNFVCDHLDDVGVKCEYAGERPKDIVQHKKKHNPDVRPFSCDHQDADGNVCDYTTNHKSNLVTHKGSHMEVKRLECSDCPRTFNTTTGRQEHWLRMHSPAGHPGRIKLYSKKFKCADCAQTFIQQCNRRSHWLRHHAAAENPKLIAFNLKTRADVKANYANNPIVRIKSHLRGAMQRFLKTLGLSKNTKTEKMVGCTYEELLVHLNSNSRGLVYGMPGVVLHIDHIRPLASFKLGCRLELLKGSNWNNLQLLTAEENMRKSYRFTPADAEAYALSVGGKAIAELEKSWRLAGVCGCEMCVQ